MPRGTLVLIVVLAAALVWWFGLRDGDTPSDLPVDPTPIPEEQPTPEPPAPKKGPELEAKGTQPAPKKIEPDLPPIAENSVTIKGRVLDLRRRPVAGATLSLLASYDAPPTRAGTTGVDGRFELRGLVRPTAATWRAFLVRATHEGTAGMGGSGIWKESPDTIDVGVITLRPAHTLDVQVRREAGAAVADARVFLEAKVQWTRSVVDRARTDAGGACRFTRIAEQAYRVIASATGHGRAVATAVFPRSETGPLVVTLGPERELAVVVTDKDTSEPIPGAALLVEEYVQILGAMGRSAQIVPYVPAMDGLVTDAQGRARLPGVGEEDIVQVHATAAGYPRVGASRTVSGSPVVDGEIRLQLQKLRTVKWPIAAASEHTPPDGTELKLEPRKGAMTRPLPPTARIEGEYVVAEDCDPGLFHTVAIAPDGAYATMLALHNSNEGREVTFLRPRKVTVIVENADGTPATDIYVSLRNQGNNVIVEPTMIGPEGTLELEVRYAWLLDAFLSKTPTSHGGAAIGSLDLKKGGGTIRGTLPAPGGRVELTVMIDGEPRLPPTYGIGYGVQSPIDLEEDPDRGILRFRLPAAAANVKRWNFAAPGFLVQTIELPEVEGDAVARVQVELSRGGHCLLRVKPPADGKQRASLKLESAKTPRFPIPMQGSQPQAQGTKDGWTLVRHGPLKPGRYLAFDSLSGAQSGSVEVKEGEEAALDLDLSAVAVIQGIVEAPEGFELHRAKVHMSGENLYANPYPGMNSGAYVRSNGKFEVRVPGNANVTLTVKHPQLIPAADGGTVEVKGGSGPVRLKLVAGGSAVFRLDPPIEQEGEGGPAPTVRVQIYDGEPKGKATQYLTPTFKDGLFTVTGFKPGTYTFVVDARKRAPGVVKNVTLGAGKTDVGTVTLPEGATVRIRLKIKEGEDAPRVFASAHCKSPVMYTRYINSNGEKEVLLKGLGAGTFELRASSMRGFGSSGAGGGKPLKETIECDGRTEIVRELDMR